MKPLFRTIAEPQRRFVQIVSFDFESFVVPVGPTARYKGPIRAGVRRINLRRLPKRSQMVADTSIGILQGANVFPPSLSVQGLGLTHSHLGALPVDDPAALSSPELAPPAPIPIPAIAMEALVAPESGKQKEPAK